MAKEKMIYRKWSLLTGPTAIISGIVTTLFVVNFFFVENDPIRKACEKKRDLPSSSKDM